MKGYTTFHFQILNISYKLNVIIVCYYIICLTLLLNLYQLMCSNIELNVKIAKFNFKYYIGYLRFKNILTEYAFEKSFSHFCKLRHFTIYHDLRYYSNSFIRLRKIMGEKI